ncbi:MAG TPA: universal stress protein [Candidatus Binatia bacterium]|nr:universal stress protein [Candidatus Binatia bacterium]
MYTKVLVPLDGSKVGEQILPYARFFAETLKLPVEMMTVIDFAAFAAHLPPGELRHLDTIVGGGIKNSKEYLQAAAQTFRGIDVQCAVETGKPGEVILEKAGSEATTLIAMATHGRSGISRWLLGSIAEKVLRGGTNPLLLVHARENGEVSRKVALQSIIVPLDGSELAEQVLPHVTALAKRMGLGIVLLRTYDIRQTISTYEDLLPEWEALQAESKAEATSYLDSILVELQAQGLANVSRVVVYEAAAEQIVKLATATPNSLIAMCTHGRSGVKRWALGSVTEKVVRHSASPVLVVRAA